MHPVTVIVPVYNEPAHRIAETVNSAIHAMAAEIVLVNDGSDEQPIIPRTPWDLQVIHQDHAGIAAALNTGLAHASHDYIAWLSCGDTMTLDKLGVQLGAMEETGALASFSDYVDAVTNEPVIAPPSWRDDMFRDNCFCGSTTIVHRSVLYSFGGWNENLNYSVDWRYHLDVELYQGWLRVAEVLGKAGEYPGGHTQTAEADARLWQKKQDDNTQVHRYANAYRKAYRRQELRVG